MITSECIISYPNLFEAKPNPSGQLKYSCSLLFDKSDTEGIKALQAAIDAAITKGLEGIWNNKLPKFRYDPLRDGDAELESGEKTDKVYEGKVFLNCSSNDAPGVVIATGQGQPKPLLDTKTIYAGCIVRADINPFPYKNSGNCGVGWGLNNILMVREGKRLDGRMNAEDAFAQYDVADEGNAAEPDGDLM